MKKFRHLLFLLLACCFYCSTALGQSTFTAHLSGHNEVVPVATSAVGEITATLNGNQLTIEGSFSGLTGLFDVTVAGGSHIHTGYAGQNGDIAFTLVPDLDIGMTSGSYDALLNSFTLSADQVTALNNRQMYINIHTTRYGGGELRGQLLPSADDYYSTTLFGSNEVPSIITDARGALALELNGNMLTVTGAFSNLSSDFNVAAAGGAHLHLSNAGGNGGISIPLNVTLNGDMRGGVFTATDNTFELNTDQMTALEARSMYANIHSINFSGGELRGQIVGQVNTLFRAHLSGVNEWPVVMTGASGQILGEITGNQLIVSGSFAGLESDVNENIAGGSHIHIAAAGSSGGIAIELNATYDADLRGGNFRPSDNTFTLTSEQMEAFYNRQCYVNIHTMDNGGGELRGQLMHESQAIFTAFLSGSQEVPDVESAAHGMIKVEQSGTRLVATGSFSELGSGLDINIAGGSHIHAGLPGTNGSIVFGLTAELDTDFTSGTYLPNLNTFTMSEGQIDTLQARGMYCNLHTLGNATGELRGNLLGEATTYFLAPLSGASETVPVNTTATGMVAIEVNGSTGTAVGSFQGLASDFASDIAGGAHLHGNIAGSNAGIIIGLNASVAGDLRSGTFTATDNTFSVSSGMLDTLRQRMFYVNIHSLDNTSGELRGQCMPLASTYFHTSLAGLNEVQPVMTSAVGGLKLELSGNQLTCSGSFSNLSGAFDPNVAGGSHLHIAGPGANGGIDITLVPTLSGDMLSGVFAAADNHFELSEDQISAVRNGNYYANIHTTTVASGELRGQIVPDVNLFPLATDISLPLPGTLINIEGDASIEFVAEWVGGSDPDGNDIAYIWQLALDEEFENMIFAQNVGDALLFSTNFGTVDALLEANGVSVGSSVTLYHRVLVSDGSNASAGPSSDVMLMRGTVTGIEETFADNFAMNVFPTITRANQSVTLEISSTEFLEDGRLVLTNTLGEKMKQIAISLAPGEHRQTIDLYGLTVGTYFLTLIAEGNALPAKRIIVR